MVNHPVMCRGLSLGNGTAPSAPLLVDRAAVNVVPDLMADLNDQNRWHNVLDEVVKCSEDVPGRLTHPAQRTVTLALLEAVCETVLEPRLDPVKIESSGLVVRRVAQDADANPLWHKSEAWMTRSDGTRGWFPLTRQEALLDPDPARRRGLGSGSDYLDAQYAQLGPSPFIESTTLAFVAPQKLCTTLKTTLLYGIVPTSDQQVASPGKSPAPPSDDDLDATVPHLLKAGTHTVPLANQTITSQYSSTDFLEQNSFKHFKKFLYLLQAAVVQYGIFDGTPEGNSLRALLDQIDVTYPPPPDDQSPDPGATIQNLSDLLLQANAVLLNPDAVSPAITSFPMPASFSSISDDLAGKIFAVIKDALGKKTAGLVPQEGRFDDAKRYYRVRAFIRVKDTSQCPAKIIWTQETGPFRIAPWYESGKLPPVHIVLPDPTDRDALKNLKPNVSFHVPGALQQMMQGTTMQGLTSGSSPAGGGVTVDWICSFSLPIITICAFFVLNIFLSLLNIVFWWMAFIKICIPIPVPKK